MKRGLVSLVICHAVIAQDCTGLWDLYLDTDPLHSKYLSGDTTTGYGVMSFWGDPDLILELQGRFPRARFLSLESEATRLAINEDALFDYEIDPLSGSENPFRDGVSINTPHRSFTVHAMQRPDEGAVNTLRLPETSLSQAIMYRIYSPNDGVTLTANDLPRVFAFNRKNAEPSECPKPAYYDPKFHFPEILADTYAAATPFEFKTAQTSDLKVAGLNRAITYLYAVTELETTQVVVIRFAAPSFSNPYNGTATFFSDGYQVRYWSLCTNDFPKNLTLNCLPDYLAPVDANGDVTVVVGRGDPVATAARERGYAFLPDIRRSTQHTMGFVYRNLLPTSNFQQDQMYQGRHSPTAVICPREQFIEGRCGL